MPVKMAAMSKNERKLPTRRAVMLVYDGVQVLDVAGAAQALTTANEEGAAPQYGLHLCALAAGTVMTASGFAIVAEALPRSGTVDTVFIPGGPGVHRARQNKDAISALEAPVRASPPHLRNLHRSVHAGRNRHVE
jgi:transcriptional regulator GlxA family with amidase domain